MTEKDVLTIHPATATEPQPPSTSNQQPDTSHQLPAPSHQPLATGHQKPATVSDVTERELIARIQGRLPPAPAWMLVGIGDDAAVIEPERNRVEVLTVDAIVEGVHFDRAFVPPDAIGYRALAVNLSDLAAMGAVPRTALLSIALPSTLPLADFDGIVGGLTRLAAEHRLHLAGGNITRSPGPLMVDVTVLGTVKRRQALTRRGARSGDELWVSGTIGSAGVGLQMLKQTARVDMKEAADPCIERYLYPEPRVRLGILLARNQAASACVDLSDGMADGVRRIAEASGVGVIVEADALPIDPSASSWSRACGVDPASAAVAAGDDYELLFTVRPRMRGRLAAAQKSGTSLTRIGICTKDTSLVLAHQEDGRRVERELPLAGYHHFR